MDRYMQEREEEGPKGCVHIYCGDGKGKTTAALGLAVRAAGRGMKVIIARFLKNEDSGEVAVLRQIPGICLKPCHKCFGFFCQMTEEQKKEAKKYYGQLFRDTWKEALEGKYDMVILDEIMAACRYGFLSEEELEMRLRERPFGLEVVMTGREPSAGLLRMADYVSEICKRKHPYDQGIGARAGVEY